MSSIVLNGRDAVNKIEWFLPSSSLWSSRGIESKQGYRRGCNCDSAMKKKNECEGLDN